jgi:hypothetical protein
MHLFTDSKAALREAVCRPSEGVSALELINKALKSVHLPVLGTRMPFAMRSQAREATHQQQARIISGMER